MAVEPLTIKPQIMTCHRFAQRLEVDTLPFRDRAVPIEEQCSVLRSRNEDLQHFGVFHGRPVYLRILAAERGGR